MDEAETLCDKYVYILDNIGHLCLVQAVLEDEAADPRVASASKIIKAKFLAQESINRWILETPSKLLKNIIRGDFMRQFLHYDPGIPHFKDEVDSDQEDGEDEYTVESIQDSRIEDGHCEYLIRWEGHDQEWDTWEPIPNILKSLETIDDWHKEHPEKLRFGVYDINEDSKDLIQIRPCTPELDTATNGHVIYAQWFLDITGDEHMFESPSTRDLKVLLADMERYCGEPEDDGEGYENHLQFIMEVDNPDPKHGLSGTWQNERNRQGEKRHLLTKDGNLHHSRLHDYQTKLFPALRKGLERISAEKEDLPFPEAWVEVGYTSSPYTRRKQHQTHSGTTSAVAFLESIAIHRFPMRQYRFFYQPVAIVSGRNDGPFLELFYTRLCRSYYWLGGFNGVTAGISAARSLNMTDEEIQRAQKDLDFDGIELRLVECREKHAEWKLREIAYELKEKETIMDEEMAATLAIINQLEETVRDGKEWQEEEKERKARLDLIIAHLETLTSLNLQQAAILETALEGKT